MTICAHDRACLFDDGRLRAIVEDVWRGVIGPEAAPGEFVVMPNHVHGIIWITREPTVKPPPNEEAEQLPGVRSGRRGEHRRSSIVQPLPRRGMRDGLDPGSLPVIVRTFKSATAKRINNRLRTPGAVVWQGDYYERIIRNNRELEATRQYILDNPRKWAEDPDNPRNLRGRTRRG